MRLVERIGLEPELQGQLWEVSLLAAEERRIEWSRSSTSSCDPEARSVTGSVFDMMWVNRVASRGVAVRPRARAGGLESGTPIDRGCA
jgi:hypothetical protein